MTDAFHTKQTFDLGNGQQGHLHSLPALEKAGIGPISRLPISIRIVLESVLRNCDGKRVREEDVRALANWNAKAPAPVEIPFVVARVVLQDFTGVHMVCRSMMLMLHRQGLIELPPVRQVAQRPIGLNPAPSLAQLLR